MNEEWKDVHGYEGNYQVSNTGNVRALNFYRNRGLIRELKLQVGTGGYICVAFPVYGTRRRKSNRVHVLVAWAFLGPRPADMFVNHKNGIKSDNRIENLEYVTAKGNVVHAHSCGLIKRRYGERCGHSKLTDDSVRNILELCSMGIPQSRIGRQFGITQSHVSRLKLGTRWKFKEEQV